MPSRSRRGSRHEHAREHRGPPHLRPLVRAADSLTESAARVRRLLSRRAGVLAEDERAAPANDLLRANAIDVVARAVVEDASASFHPRHAALASTTRVLAGEALRLLTDRRVVFQHVRVHRDGGETTECPDERRGDASAMVPRTLRAPLGDPPYDVVAARATAGAHCFRFEHARCTCVSSFAWLVPPPFPFVLCIERIVTIIP